MRSLWLGSFVLFTSLLTGCPGDGTDKPGTDSGGDSGSDSVCLDSDGDGYNSCEDCDDTNAGINPGAEEDCDGVDNDCDGDIDEGVTSTYYADDDGDGFGDPTTSTDACEPSGGWVPTSDDCDDADPYVYPGAEEICDGVDNDCNDTIDDGLESTTYYADSDGDGFGNPDESLSACDQPDGYTDNADDCDDLNSMEPVIVDAVAGTSTGTGTSTNPLDTVQAGIDQAEECVYAMPGTYNEDINFSGKDILVKGMDGAEATFLVGTGETSVVTFDSGESAEAVLTGFTVMGGAGTVVMETETTRPDSYTTLTTTIYSYYGGGIFVSASSPTLYDLIVTGNELPAYSYSNPSAEEEVYVYSYGGGIFAADATVEWYNLNVVDNYADMGGGQFFNSASTADQKWSVLDGNWASSGGGVSTQGTLNLSNSILVDNGSSSGGGAVGGAGVDVMGGTANLDFVTLASNEGVASVFLSSAGVANITDSIIFDNDSGYMIDGDAGTDLNMSFADVYGGASGNYGSAFTDPTGVGGNISADPGFVSWSDDDNYADNLDVTGAAAGAASDDGDIGAYGGADGTW